MIGIRILAALSVTAVLVAGCARWSEPRETADAMRVTPPVANTCESALGSAIAPGLMTARSYAMANLALRTEETRYALLGKGARRFQVTRHAVRCKPYSVIYTAGRMYRCSTSAHVCARG